MDCKDGVLMADQLLMLQRSIVTARRSWQTTLQWVNRVHVPRLPFPLQLSMWPCSE